MSRDIHRQIVEVATAQRDLVDAQIAGLSGVMHERWARTDLALQTAMTAQQRAIGRAQTTIDDRFKSVNEFRAVLSDQAARFATRTEVETHAGTNAGRISELQRRLDRLEGAQTAVVKDREVQRQTTMVVFGACSIIITIIVAAITFYIATGR